MRARGPILYITVLVVVGGAIGAVLIERRKADEGERLPQPQVVRIPPGTATPRGALPPGAMPPGAMPPGAFPPGAFPPGALPPGAMPPGGMPPGSPLLPPSTLPPLLPPLQPGAVSRPPPIPGRIDTTSRPPFGGGVHTQPVVDLNSAPVSMLVTLPGITTEYAKLIVAHRPYRDRTDLEKAGLPHDVVEKLGPPAMIRSVETLPPPGRGR